MLVIGFIIVAGLFGAFSSIGKSASVTPADTPTPTETAIPAALATFMATETPVFASSPIPTPKPTQPPIAKPQPTQPPPTPKPTQPACQGVNGNPWCYNFSSPGNLIYSPNAAFCNYFACVSTFWTATSGYVAECANGDYTHSGSVRGACSHDGGVMRPLYSH